MCDYSFHGIENRLAQEGEVLVVHRFYSGSKGLTSPEYLEPIEQGTSWMGVLKKLFSAHPRDCAVCIPDGAQLTLHGISPSARQIHGLSAIERVTFRQLSADDEVYRDAMEFTNGVTVLLQELEEGQRVEVLALSSENAVIEDAVEICEE